MLPQFLLTEKPLNGRDPAAHIEQLHGAGMPEAMGKTFPPLVPLPPSTCRGSNPCSRALCSTEKYGHLNLSQPFRSIIGIFTLSFNLSGSCMDTV